MLDVSRLSPSLPDSRRFGLEVWRASTIGSARSVREELIDSGADVAIYRLPVGASRPVSSLAQHGFEVINAGVLVYYTVDLTRHAPRAPDNADLVITPTHADDDADFAALVDASFTGYVSHYLANPLFAPDLALAGYREWALRHRLDDTRSASWVARRDGVIVAFACCEFDRDSGVANGGIYGVLPGQSRGGVFGDLIRHTQMHFKGQGFGEMRMSTKVDNLAVQKVWVREGFHLYAAYDTLHVNAMLSAGSRTAQQRTYRFADPSSMRMLLADALAEALAARDAQGDVALLQLSQLPLAALQADIDYRLTVTCPSPPRSDGLRRAVARVHGGDGRLLLLAQATVRDVAWQD